MNDASIPGSDVLLDEIGRLLRELHPRDANMPAVWMGARLDRDLGLDSLSRMELLMRLEKRLHVSVVETRAVEARTPADLLRVLAASPSWTASHPGPAAALASQVVLATPEDARTLPEVLAWHAQRHPDRVHVHFTGGEADGIELTYAGLYAAASEVAGGLQREGLRDGEPVALMFPTHPDLLIAFFAVMLAGGVPVPLYPPLRPGELGDYWGRQTGILRNCGARLMLVAPALFAHRHAIGTLAGGVERLLAVASLRGHEPLSEPAPRRGDHLAMLQYTSGSTADPKGVMLSHDNLLANIRIMGRQVGASARDVFVSWLPLYHDMGLIGAWLGSLYFGIPLVLMPPQAFLLHPEQWLRAIDRFGATLSAAPNFAYELCLHRIEDHALDDLDLHRLRICFCGAEPVFPDTLERFTARFARAGLAPAALLPVYGLAENSLGLTFPPAGRGIRVLRVRQDRFLRHGEAVVADDEETPSLQFVSCGVPLPAHEVRVVDDYDHELSEGRQGRIQFRGPSATAGYFRQPQLTRELFHDGWLDTGDLGFVRQGELYLTGRAKDLVIRAGQHLHPQGIEQAVGEVPGIRRGRVAAFGTRKQGTERLVVVAETRVTEAARRQQLQRAVNAAVHACTGAPADEVVLAAPGAILKTSSGKLRRSACRNAFEGGRLDTPDRWRLLAVVVRSQWDRLRRVTGHAGMLAYAAYAWLLLGLAVVPMLAWLALPVPAASRWWTARRLLGAVAAAAGIRVRMHLVEALPERPCIFVSNHASYADALALVCALPRPVAFVAKRELASLPLVGWMLRRLGVVFVARSDPHTHARALQQVSRGAGDVLFFPEGTFRSMPGLVHFRLGAFVAAVEAGMPVVPVALRGTRAVLRDDEWLPHPGTVDVTIAAAIHPRRTPDTWPEALRLAAETRAPILKYCGEPDADSERPDMPDAQAR